MTDTTMRQPQVFVLMPAHNEAETIGPAITSVWAQVRQPTELIVVADNCTDDTVAIALSRGASVFVTAGNRQQKAGALNQALRNCSGQDGWHDEDLVLVMDADSTITSKWISTATAALGHDRSLGAVGGVFYGDDRPGLLAQLQRNEYTRYAREIAAKRGRVQVLTGTATMFRWSAMRAVAGMRASGDVYDTAVLTEDNEITLAMKTLGHRLISPRNCRVYTETMPTWRALWLQRLRWQRGAIENLRHYGVTRVTLPYLLQQSAMVLGVVLFLFYVTVMVSAVALFGLHWSPLWLAIGGVFVAERLVTVWAGGWRARLTALLMFPEMAFDVFLMAVLVRSGWDIARRRQAVWHHAAGRTPATAR